MKYALWNNKGGVGKSFLTFTLATEYAYMHPKRNVYIVDMCPQANVSEIVLGGNGFGEKSLGDLIKKRQTIGGYFDSRIKTPHTLTGDESGFHINVESYNEKSPKNLYLVAGDPSLEIQAEAMNQLAALTLPEKAWRNVHSWLKDLIQAVEKKYPQSTFFVDCNPSFAAYTELSLVATDRLIVPCTADGSSARAIRNLSQLVYAHDVSLEHREALFSTKVKRESLSVPSIYMVLLNRSTQYNKRASKAFNAMFDNIKNHIEVLFDNEPSARGNNENLFYDIPDTHSVAIVASHIGIPIRNIQVGRYNVYDKTPQVNRQALDRYTIALKKITEKL